MSKPDWFYLMSGGKDSVAAALVADKAVQQNYQKTPVAVYLDTTVGIPANRIYVEELCDRMGWHLWTLRTHENYDERIQENGCPGPADHSNTYNALKGRQLSKLATVSRNPVFVTGINKHESASRAQADKADYTDRSWRVKPIFTWMDKQIREYVDEHAPVKNPLWDTNYFQDCACGAMATPEELIDAASDGFEWFVQRIREYEESADFQDKRGTWGWGGTNRKTQRALDAKNDDNQTMLCSADCGRVGQVLKDE